MKQLFKEALSEMLEERRDLLQELVAEVLEDLALAEAIREGRGSELTTRDEVFSILEGGG